MEIEIIDDDVWEETETFFVRLFNPTRGTEMDKICVTQVSIINDDGWLLVVDSFKTNIFNYMT